MIQDSYTPCQLSSRCQIGIIRVDLRHHSTIICLNIKIMPPEIPIFDFSAVKADPISLLLQLQISVLGNDLISAILYFLHTKALPGFTDLGNAEIL